MACRGVTAKKRKEVGGAGAGWRLIVGVVEGRGLGEIDAGAAADGGAPPTTHEGLQGIRLMLYWAGGRECRRKKKAGGQVE